MLRILGIVSIAFVFGIGVGGVWSQTGSRFNASAATAVVEANSNNLDPGPTVVTPHRESGTSLTEAGIRSLLREELASALHELTLVDNETLPPDSGELLQQNVSWGEDSAVNNDNNEVSDSDQAFAFSHVTELVQQKLVQGVWNAEDRRAFREAYPQLNDSQREQVVSQLVVAMNNGSIQVTMDGPPL